MKNRLLIVITAFLIVFAAVFTACAQNELSTDMTSIPESSLESTPVLSDSENESLAEEVPDEEASADAESEPDECVHGEDNAFVIASAGGTYSIFPENKTGSFLSEFTAVLSENVITITLADGRAMEFSYGEIVSDESEESYRTVINDLDFRITESHDGNNNRVQIYECIEPIDYFSNNLTSMIIVTYYPETEKGSLQIWFTYESDGEDYTFHYADGHTASKTILYDESNETHYFAESEAEQE